MNLFTSSFKHPGVPLKGILPLLGVLVLFLLIEMGFRAWHFGFNALFQFWHYSNRGLFMAGITSSLPDPELCYRLKPNLDTWFRGAAPFRTNKHGFREQEVDLQKPVGVIRIAMLGRSVTMGAGVGDEEIFSRRLQLYLDQAYPGRFQILNFAVGGYRPRQVAQNYEVYVKRFQPDALLWTTYYGELTQINPACRRPEQVKPEWDNLRGYLVDFFSYGALRNKVGADWLANLPGNEWHIRGRNIPPPPPSLSYRKIMEKFIAARQEEGIPIGILALPLPPVTSLQGPQEKYPLYRQELRNWAANQSGVYLFDLVQPLQHRITEEDAIYLGDFHPKPHIHELYARELYNQLVDFMRPGR